MNEIIRSVLFLFVLLNPFLIIVYLVDIVKNKSALIFRKVLIRAGIISFIVFSSFAILGDTIFNNLLQANFSRVSLILTHSIFNYE